MKKQDTPYHHIDMATYPRCSHFDYFRTMAYPYVGITVDVDVTGLKDLCRVRGYSFYLMFMHAAALAADRVPELRRRIREDGIIEYEVCDTSHTEALEDGTYRYCTLRHHLPLPEYIAEAEERRAACRRQGALEEDEDADRLYFISTLPWVRYTALIQPAACGDESNPRITWGKYETDHRGRLMMPVSLLCHHALVDGIHMAAFYDCLNDELRKFCDGLPAHV